MKRTLRGDRSRASSSWQLAGLSSVTHVTTRNCIVEPNGQFKKKSEASTCGTKLIIDRVSSEYAT